MDTNEGEDAVEVRVRMRAGTGPMEGSIESAADGERPFGGWMELMAALDGLRSGTDR
ncbi:MAG: hypothetical protein H0W25_18205 [Acidimicrobiia bacterium]|nr:hypothetical protein [Acidimicrobiia bacterium]